MHLLHVRARGNSPRRPRHAGRPCGPATAGFTLIEMMVTVAIAGILLAVGVPAMQNFLTSRAVLSQAEELAATLRLARSDALRLNTTISVCAAADTAATAPVCGTDWGKGWLSFIDVDKNGARAASTDRLLRVQPPLKSVKAITSDTQGYVQFFPNGLPATGAAKFEVQPQLDAKHSSYQTMLRTVRLNTAGRAMVITGSSGS